MISGHRSIKKPKQMIAEVKESQLSVSCCLNCGKELSIGKYCDASCGSKHRSRIKTIERGREWSLNTSTGTTGAVGELIVAADLLTKNFSVFRSVSPASEYDLVVIINNKPLTVEVRMGYKNNSGEIRCPTKSSKPDIWAAVYQNKAYYFNTNNESIEL